MRSKAYYKGPSPGRGVLTLWPSGPLALAGPGRVGPLALWPSPGQGVLALAGPRRVGPRRAVLTLAWACWPGPRQAS